MDDDIRLCFENAYDNFLREPQTILTMYNEIYKSRGMGPEMLLSFCGGMILRWTMVFIFFHHGRIPEKWEIGEISKLIERRTSEMITIFQSAMRQ